MPRSQRIKKNAYQSKIEELTTGYHTEQENIYILKQIQANLSQVENKEEMGEKLAKAVLHYNQQTVGSFQNLAVIDKISDLVIQIDQQENYFRNLIKSIP